MAGNMDFQQFNLTDEHMALREAVQDLVRDKIAPRAADIDETGEFPWDVYEALRASGFHAIHIPEAYGGEGGDALAACLVIEEVARGCASSSLIPAVNKLGTMPLMVAGDEALLQTYLPQVASGEAMFSYALSEREAGSDAASMKARAVEKDGGWVLNGQKIWISHARHADFMIVMAVTDPAKGSRGGITAFLVDKGSKGLSIPSVFNTMGEHAPYAVFFDNVELSDDQVLGDVGNGFGPMQNRLGVRRMEIACRSLGYARRCMDLS